MTSSTALVEKLEKRLQKHRLTLPSFVKKAFQSVDRINFVSSSSTMAYEDRPLPIPENQTISAPHMYAMMMSNEIADLHENLDVLEIGTGSGYGAALLAQSLTSGTVVSIERHQRLHEFASHNLERSKLDFDNLELLVGDGTNIQLDRKFDRILVTAAGPRIPPGFREHLKQDGFVIMPLEKGSEQWLTVISYNQDKVTIDYKFQVKFVPLIGKYGH